MGLALWSCDKCEGAFTEHEDSILCQKCRKEYCEDCQSRYDIVPVNEEEEDRIVALIKEQRADKIKCDYCDYSKRWVHNETNEVMK